MPPLLVRLAVVAVIVVATALAAGTWRTFGHTWDEPEHLAAGLELLDRGKYEYDTEHPPLARVLIALGPYLAGSRSFGTPPPDGTQEGVDILYAGDHYNRTLTLARLGALPFLGLLLAGVWLWARRVLESENAALLAVVLLASVPPVLGHAALATLDVPGAATTLIGVYFLQRWLAGGTRRDALLSGLTAGVALATKFSALPFLGISVLVLIAARLAVKARSGSASATLAASANTGRSMDAAALPGTAATVVLVAVAALVPVVLAYGPRSFDLTGLPARFNWVLLYLLPDKHAQASALIAHLRLPEAFWDFAEGIVALKAHNDTGHVSFLLGHVRAGGWWYFYIVDLAVKTPLPLLVTGLAGLGLLAYAGWRERNAWRLAPLLLFAALLTFASLYSRINIGIRHVLILYPFLTLGGAYALTLCWRSVPGRCVAIVLVGWQLSTWWSSFPDYFPYFNELVRQPQRVVIDSDLDWGQDLRRLVARLAVLGVPQISLAYQGTADLTREHLPAYVLLPPRQPVTGWVAINALSREHAPLGYAWLDFFSPVERIGKTIDLYFIPAPQLPGSPARQ